MSVHAHTRPRPAATRGGAETRLPWWALALPALAFACLLGLILNPSEAQAATGAPSLVHLFEQLLPLIAR
ncbi:hypothetical protein [Streptomyces sp. V3I7]|uniref:hypothetical protein n=1 Tax=Streptomyces sp. V3I7 TaxID=3042278 RepID=UPI002784D5FC|nr:hypothetical protein [Streptomyces sp. V3I7]MDQ0990120.1 anti-sigma-K factor RskA [Streptomyces sp. V3I7]